MKMTYDIIILGSGIAGLLLGSELSSKCKVLILEKEKQIPIQKYWLTDLKNAPVNSELLSCVDSEYSFMDFISYNFINYRLKGNYALWNTNKLTDFLKNIVLSSTTSSTVITNLKFFTYQNLDNVIQVYASDLKFNCKILIDCMGSSSPLIYAKNVVNICGFYLMYGAVLNTKAKIEPIGLHNINVNKNPLYLEVFPTKNNNAYVTIILPQKKIKNAITTLKEDFDFIIKKSFYSKYFYEDYADVLYGIIPAGNIKKNNIENIFFYGEAGLINPAASATGLTRMLLTYKKFCKVMISKLEGNKNKFDKDLYVDSLNNNLQVNLFNEILNWNSDDFAEFIRELEYISSQTANDLIFGNVEMRKLLNLNEFKNLRKHPMLTKLFFKSYIMSKIDSLKSFL